MLSESVITESRESQVPVKIDRRRLIWLVLSPCIFLFVYIFYVQARGPFWLGSNSDPDYAYLCNALNIVRGRAPHLVNHPGTPLQVLGAVVIRAAHPFTRSRDITDTVLRNPEAYLRWMNYVLAAIYALSLGLAGLLVWRRTGDWEGVIFLQAAPFLLGDQFRMLARVSAETLLLIAGVLIMGTLFIAAREGDKPAPVTSALGFLTALGITAKVSFFPFAVVPLCIQSNRKQRAHFLLWFAGWTALFLFPLRRHAARLAEFVYGLVFRQKKYGFGDPGVVPPEYFSNLLRLPIQNPWLCIVVVLSWVTVLYGCTRWKRAAAREHQWVLLLGGLALAQTLQMLVVAKYGEWRYLLPALLFCPLNLLLVWKLWRSRLPKWTIIGWGALAIAAIGITITMTSSYLRFKGRSAGRMRIARALQSEFSTEPLVYYYSASTLSHALAFGDYWAGGAYTKRLKEMFRTEPRSYRIAEGSGEVYQFSEKLGDLRDFGQFHSSFIMVGSAGLAPRITMFLPPNAETQKLLEAGGEVVHRVTLPRRSR